MEVVARPSEIPLKLHETVAEGETTYAATVKLDGRATILFVRPRCGEVGRCPDHESTVDGRGKLTMSPSLVCDCGGHYWLTNGMLREV